MNFQKDINKIRLLIVEDDESLLYIVKESLELTGFYDTIYTASNGKEGLEIYHSCKLDMIIVDIELPIISGFGMVEKIRETDSIIPIIFATAKKTPRDFINGLKVGADSFIRKPYLPEEIHAQVQALIKRIKEITDEKPVEIIQLGNVTLNTKFRYLESLSNDKKIKLSEREFRILLMLYKKQGELIYKEDILKLYWNNCNFYTNRSLDVVMTKLRKSVCAENSVLIQTVRGEGYILIT